MFSNFFRLIFLGLLISSAIVCVHAQIDMSDASTRSGRSDSKEDLPKGIKESLAKSRIERAKKDYQELLENSEEAAKLSVDLEKSFVASNTLSSEDRKKLERLEKLVKKIRSELGGGDAEDAEEKPSSMANAFKTLQNTTSKLFVELKKTSRYSISAFSIQSSNALINVVRFIRFGKN